MNPHQVTRDFEREIAAYTGARFAVTTTSCTAALLIALLWFRLKSGGEFATVTVPRYTYVGVGMSVLNSGHRIAFRDETWSGEYQMSPYNLYDSARRTRRGMFRPGSMQCLSLHWSKILGVSQGGVILHDDFHADGYLRRLRFDGRREGVRPVDDDFNIVGHHCYMAPATAAEALTRLALLPDSNPDLPWDDYADLSTMRVFR